MRQSDYPDGGIWTWAEVADVSDQQNAELKAEVEKLKQLVKSAFNAHQVHKVYDTDLVKIMDEWCEQAREALQTFARLEDK
jgi:hypothetical protein